MQRCFRLIVQAFAIIYRLLHECIQIDRNEHGERAGAVFVFYARVIMNLRYRHLEKIRYLEEWLSGVSGKELKKKMIG